MRKIILIGILLSLVGEVCAQAEKFSFTGTVRDKANGEPLQGAIINLSESELYAVTDSKGSFAMDLQEGEHLFTIRYLGYDSLIQVIEIPSVTHFDFRLLPSGISMGEVEIVATGYQELPKERATGSFVQLDNELINRRVSTNIMDRLEDVTSGLVFNRTGPATDPISIRGRSTIFANTQPLIIIDNFPYDGPLENINPNDVESITVLRDAAAASIWGARAGNGVIVITTKKGKTSAPQVSFNSNINRIEAPDLFYQPVMGIGDFIDVERTLFDRGYYSSAENSANKPALSPVVETLIAQRDGLLTGQEAENRIQDFRTRDVRRDLQEHYYRPQVNQQHALNISGGTDIHRYVFSAGVDRNMENIQGNSNGRITLNAQNQWRFLKNRLNVGVGLYYARQTNEQTTELPTQTFPYDALTDRNGNPIPITQKYSQRFLASEMVGDLLDWRYVPLEEIGKMRNQRVQDDYRANLSLGYKILPGLSADILYQYWQNSNSMEAFRDQSLFSTRDMINQFTQRNPDGSLHRPVPEGGIMDLTQARASSHSFRSQLTFNKTWNDRHELNALGGYELKDHGVVSNSTRYYGYSDALGISRPVDQVGQYSLFHSGWMSSIFNGAQHSGTTDRFVSYYFNSGYTYLKKYNLSISARKDASNLFGVETNMRGVPLWSAGAGWILSGEDFYRSGFMPFVKLRASYGVNGNVDKTLTALTTARYYTNSAFVIPAGELAGHILNPANPLLRWEQIKILNLGMDFESKEGRLKGSFEFYAKKGSDLIGDAPLAPSTGMERFRGNSANTESKGVDIDIQSRNLVGPVQWQTNFLYSYIDEKVTNYYFRGSVLNYLTQSLGTLVPLEGKPLFAIYSLPWAGLDPDTGNPLGYVNGEVSNNYSAIFSNTDPETLQYHGSRRPTSFGAVRNTFSWRGLSLSVNVSYRLGYFYRRESINYATVLSGTGGHADFAKRWQQPGDELMTNVPSMPATNQTQRNNFYRFSEILVEKGDHVRLQDIRLSYNLNRQQFRKLPFQNAEIYSYANNLGILWKASDDPLDPDFRTMRPLTSIAVGARIDF